MDCKDSSLLGSSFLYSIYRPIIILNLCQVPVFKTLFQEEFLDVQVAVAGISSLEQSLHVAYNDIEMLDGKNQYKCGGCKKLVDAEKVKICTQSI